MDRPRQLLGDLVTSAQRLNQSLQRWIAEGWTQPLSDTAWIRTALDSDDLTLRKITARRSSVIVAYLATQVDMKLVLSTIDAPLTASSQADPRKDLPGATFATMRDDVLSALVAGKAAVFKSGAEDAAIVDVRVNRARGVGKPTVESALVGSSAFNGDITTGINLVRKVLATPSLRVRELVIGTLSRTRTAVIWIDGIASPRLVEETLDRLSRVQTDTLLTAEDLHQLAFHRTWSPFPTIQRTELSVRVAEGLGLGRIAIIVDGEPRAILVPLTLGALMKYVETMVGPPLTVVFVRWLRYVGVGAALITPAVYVALLSVDPTLVPPDTLIAVALTRVGVPYPVLFETFAMLLIVDLTLEAMAQAPSQIGQAVTVVGGLIIGQAAVQAHIGSQLMVIVNAVTSIGVLLVPDISTAYAVRMTKYPIMIFAGIFGFYGLTLCLIALAIHLVAQESLDTPYATPFGPVEPRSLRSYALLSRARPESTLRPATYRPTKVRRQPQGGMTD